MPRLSRFLLLIALLLPASCRREERDFAHGGPRASHAKQEPANPPGGRDPLSAYETNAHAMNEGRTLYTSFNCVGCHAHGGGDFGPAFMDAKWLYGSNPDDIYRSIMDGRPNGMPEFRHKITPTQGWQLTAYIRSLSGQVPFGAAPGREDHLKTSPAPSSLEQIPPATSRP